MPRDFEADRKICDAVTAFHDMWRNEDGRVTTYDADECEWFPLFNEEISPDDARFIAEACTGWPAALDEITRLQRDIRSLHESLYLEEAEKERLRAELAETSAELSTEINDFDRLQSEVQRYRQALESIVMRSRCFVSNTAARELRKMARRALDESETSRDMGEN